MNRCNLVRLGLGVWLAAAAHLTFAQQALEIIPLRYRTAEQVLPALQPLLEPGATLSGMRGQLFLRASPSNADDIKRALAAIDRPAKRLQISVRLDDAAERERRDIQASGSIGSGGVRFSGSAQDSHTNSGERVDQRLQVLEGSQATIFTGRSTTTRTWGTASRSCLAWPEVWFTSILTSQGFRPVPRPGWANGPSSAGSPNPVRATIAASGPQAAGARTSRAACGSRWRRSTEERRGAGVRA